jgi:hypothetical protein
MQVLCHRGRCRAVPLLLRNVGYQFRETSAEAACRQFQMAVDRGKASRKGLTSVAGGQSQSEQE